MTQEAIIKYCLRLFAEQCGGYDKIPESLLRSLAGFSLIAGKQGTADL